MFLSEQEEEAREFSLSKHSGAFRSGSIFQCFPGARSTELMTSIGKPTPHLAVFDPGIPIYNWRGNERGITTRSKKVRCGQPLQLTISMSLARRPPSCGERTTLLTTAGEKETSRPQASSTMARPSSTLASHTLPSTLIFHPCRVRFVLPAPMRTPPPRTAGLMRSSNANSLTLVSRRSPLGHMVLLGRPPTASSKPPLLTPLAQCLALGCGQAPSNTLTYYSVLLSLEQTLAC